MAMIGGPGEVRTPDPMVANHVLSQLSYRPIFPYNHTGWEILIRQAKGSGSQIEKHPHQLLRSILRDIGPNS